MGPPRAMKESKGSVSFFFSATMSRRPPLPPAVVREKSDMLPSNPGMKPKEPRERSGRRRANTDKGRPAQDAAMPENAKPYNPTGKEQSPSGRFNEPVVPRVMRRHGGKNKKIGRKLFDNDDDDEGGRKSAKIAAEHLEDAGAKVQPVRFISKNELIDKILQEQALKALEEFNIGAEKDIEVHACVWTLRPDGKAECKSCGKGTVKKVSHKKERKHKQRSL